MLKQWFLGRKKYPDPLQDPSITCPLGERYVVYRTNPIYIDDNHWTDTTDGKQVSVIAPHDPKLHVQTWCSLVCPNHLTTCCACKPAWTYCDSCHPIRYHAALPSPDVLLSTKRVLGRVRRKKLPPEVTLSPSNLVRHDKGMEVAHFYHVIDPAGDSGQCRLHGHRRTLDPKPPLPTRKTDHKKPPLLQIYINSDFVSGIAVTGSNAIISDAVALPDRTPQLEAPHYVNAPLDGQAVSDGLLDISAETDSLESLRIDEQIFAPASSTGTPTSVTSPDVSGHIAAVDIGVDRDDRLSPSECISPTGSRILLTDSEVAYEAVRDLYEKLSNNRHRQVVTQAMNGTQRSRALKNYVQNTYETLTKHVRNSYAKLVEEELQRSPSLYLVPTGPSSAEQSPPTPPATSKRGSGHLDETGTAGLKVLTGSLIELGTTTDDPNLKDSQPRKSTSHTTKMVPDVAYEVTNSDQFITRRDPKYDEQPIPAGGTDAESPVKNAGHRLYDSIRKRFKQKNYRDALKIIITTLVGLTAFGIITALSLSINRQ